VGYQWNEAEGTVPPSYADFNDFSYSDYGTNDYGGADTYATNGYTSDMFTSYDSSYQYQAVPYSYAASSSYAAPYMYTEPTYTAQNASYELNQAQMLRCAPGDSRWRADEIGQAPYGTTSRSSTLTNVVQPYCRLTPTSTGTGTVILQWVTNNATTAFIDNGIGHVSLGTGGRMVTPLQSTVYTMTVVNERGASAQCAANIVVRGSSPVGAQTVTIGQNPQQNNRNAQNTTQVQQGTNPTNITNPTNATNTTNTATNTLPQQVDANGNPLTAVTNEASTIGTNIFSSITNALGGGQSIWERIRTVSLIALAIFIVMAIVVTVMRRMFGGGEAAH
jgi:hypothetical protein